MESSTPWPGALRFLIDGGSIIFIAAAVAKTFDWFDGMVSDEARQALSSQLKKVPSDDRIDSWASIFPRLIDKVFGDSAWSWKFFARSCLASLIAVALIFAVYARSHPLAHKYPVWLQKSAGEMALLDAASFLSRAIVLNFLPDYLSLLVSRTIVRMMAKAPTTTRIFRLLILDTVFTAAISFLAIYVVYLAIKEIVTGSPMQLSGFYSGAITSLDDIWRILAFRRLASVYFYSAFFTSVWVWLYVLSIYVIRAAHRLRFVWAKITPYLDIDKRPLVAVGRVAGLLAGLGYSIVLGVIWISHHWL